jgi:hypothetical protein
MDKLEKYPDTYWGVDLKKFKRRMTGTMHRLLNENPAPPLDVKNVPFLKLAK